MIDKGRYHAGWRQAREGGDVKIICRSVLRIIWRGGPRLAGVARLCPSNGDERPPAKYPAIPGGDAKPDGMIDRRRRSWARSTPTKTGLAVPLLPKTPPLNFQNDSHGQKVQL